jgi:flagellar basal-body rod protein FlgG
MIRALYTAASGMNAQETNIDVISNNLANVNTVGFKKSRADFEDLMYQYIVEPGAPTSQQSQSPSGTSVGLGVKTSGVQRIFTSGDISNTGRELDIAISGEGFFRVQLPDGTFGFTRAGNFQMNQDGQLVTAEGYPLDPAITITNGATGINIASDGTVSARVPGQAELANLGIIAGSRFPNNSGLRAIGQNLYVQTDSSGPPTDGVFGLEGFGRLEQKQLESSNVSVVEQVVNMITAQRAYEASSKGISTADQMLSEAINLKR